MMLWEGERNAESERRRAVSALMSNGLVGALPGDLAVGAGVLAAQRDDEHVQAREKRESIKARPCFQRQKINRQLLLSLPQNVLRAKPPREGRGSVQRLPHKRFKVSCADEKMLTDHVCQKNALS